MVGSREPRVIKAIRLLRGNCFNKLFLHPQNKSAWSAWTVSVRRSRRHRQGWFYINWSSSSSSGNGTHDHHLLLVLIKVQLVHFLFASRIMTTRGRWGRSCVARLLKSFMRNDKATTNTWRLANRQLSCLLRPLRPVCCHSEQLSCVRQSGDKGRGEGRTNRGEERTAVLWLEWWVGSGEGRGKGGGERGRPTSQRHAQDRGRSARNRWRSRRAVLTLSLRHRRIDIAHTTTPGALCSDRQHRCFGPELHQWRSRLACFKSAYRHSSCV